METVDGREEAGQGQGGGEGKKLETRERGMDKRKEGRRGIEKKRRDRKGR